MATVFVTLDSTMKAMNTSAEIFVTTSVRFATEPTSGSALTVQMVASTGVRRSVEMSAQLGSQKTVGRISATRLRTMSFVLRTTELHMTSMREVM